MRGLFGETDVKEEYLKKCLTGDIYKIDSLLLGAENDCAGYALAVASVSNFARFAARFSDEDFSSVSSMIKIMGEKSFQQLGGVVGTQTDSNVYVWLVCIKSGASGGIFAAAEELRTGMTELCGVDVTVVINEELASLDDVPEIFRICMQTRAEYIMYSCGGVLDCEGLPGASGGFEYPAASEKQITGCVDMNDRNGYVDAISDFFAAIRDKRPWSGIVRTTVNQLLGTLMSYILQDASGMPEIFGGDLYAQLAQIETLDEMELFLSNVGVRIIACREETGNANESYISEIVDFIHRNYHRDISVSDIAGSVNLSYSHVRKIFFEKMNTTILLYINNLRIEEAKKLLSETRKAISEIAVEIGYNNDQSFSRYFKKATGITPGEWRRRKLGENQRKDNI